MLDKDANIIMTPAMKELYGLYNELTGNESSDSILGLPVIESGDVPANSTD